LKVLYNESLVASAGDVYPVFGVTVRPKGHFSSPPAEFQVSLQKEGVNSCMKVTPDLFEAFLKCPTKCWLRASGEPGSGNAYAEWVKSQNEAYRATATERLLSETRKEESAFSSPTENLKTAQWRLATGAVAQAQMNSCFLESEIHAVERASSGGRGRPTQFILIRFIFTNKLDKDAKLLLAFDAFVLAQMLGRTVILGKSFTATTTPHKK